MEPAKAGATVELVVDGTKVIQACVTDVVLGAAEAEPKADKTGYGPVKLFWIALTSFKSTR